MGLSVWDNLRIVGGVFGFLACVVSGWSIVQHLRHFFKPDSQRHVVRILLFVPIYSLDSFLSLLVPGIAIYFDVIRDCYGAFVIWSFFKLCEEYLHGQEVIIATLEARTEPIHHPIPFCYFTVRGSRAFVLHIKRCVLQYVICKPVIAVITIILQLAEVYQMGVFKPDTGYLWMTVFDNCSVTVSLYALALFYMATKEDLAEFRPIWKFACVKAIVFFSFWQGVLISILGSVGAIPSNAAFPEWEVAVGIQDALICVEMFLIAIAMLWAFDYSEFLEHQPVKTPLVQSIRAQPVYELKRLAASGGTVLNFREDLEDVNQLISVQNTRRRADEDSDEE